MIARLWPGHAKGANAAAYLRHFTDAVAPQLKALAGHKGAWLLRREVGGDTEFLAISLWESLEAIRVFAGEAVEMAIVEPQAQAALSSFDRFARHYEVVAKG